MLMVTFSSCKKDSGTISDSTVMPPYIAVGHKWIYDASGFSGYSTVTYEIDAVNGTNYHQKSTFDGDAGGDAYFYAKDGFLCVYEPPETRGGTQRRLKLNNAAVGDVWSRIVPGKTYYHELKSLNESVTVPAGTFICKKVEVTFSDSFNSQDEYWNDEYGLIKLDNFILSVELKSKNF